MGILRIGRTSIHPPNFVIILSIMVVVNAAIFNERHAIRLIPLRLKALPMTLV